ncbi:MAG: hypothetical protein M1820_010091 [Bogoriella megaspora]|nr:MAG: hypothetical protein M1820_010091 [Bogoriella megaspora]
MALQTPRSLLDLPPEIRLMIYGHLEDSNRSTTFGTLKPLNPGELPRKDIRTSYALSQTCQIVHREVMQYMAVSGQLIFCAHGAGFDDISRVKAQVQDVLDGLTSKEQSDFLSMPMRFVQRPWGDNSSRASLIDLLAIYTEIPYIEIYNTTSVPTECVDLMRDGEVNANGDKNLPRLAGWYFRQVLLIQPRHWTPLHAFRFVLTADNKIKFPRDSPIRAVNGKNLIFREYLYNKLVSYW